MKTLLLASTLFVGLFGYLAAVPAPVTVPVPVPFPYHAFCRTMWLFATNCAEISTKVVQQILAFNPEYMLVSATPLSIKANHTSLDNPEGENITFTFSPTILTGGCRMTGLSSSLGFTSLLDGGLNYCNLYNLLSASGVTSEPGITEMTNEWSCLGYGLSTCKA
ncbi:hypothetical protein ABVT39_006466 [Epinephelus coioides]